MELAALVLETITEAQTQFIAVQILPAAQTLQTHADSDSDCLEVGLPKKSYVQLFLEGHGFLADKYDPREAELPPKELTDLYVATTAVLLATNDHVAAWRVHERVVWELFRRKSPGLLAREWKFASALATARLDRVNKSSLVWHWIRVLWTARLMVGVAEPDFHAAVSVILRSMETHFANYCAGYTLFWLVDVCVLHGVGKPPLDLLRAQARRKLSDCSMWSAYGNILAGKEQPYNERVALQLLQRCRDAGLEGNLPSYVPLGATTRAFMHEWAQQDLAWLLSVQTTIFTPYLYLSNVLGYSAVADAIEAEFEHRGKMSLAVEKLRLWQDEKHEEPHK